jgi:hypothetical protein
VIASARNGQRALISGIQRIADHLLRQEPTLTGSQCRPVKARSSETLPFSAFQRLETVDFSNLTEEFS